MTRWLAAFVARTLAKHGAAKRHASVIDRAQQMRRELGLPPHPALGRP